jgi:hypothetical protein
MMALERALRDCGLCCRALGARLTELRTSFVEDRPGETDLALFSHLGQSIDDLVSVTIEAANALAAAATSDDAGNDREMRRGLVAAHELVNKMGRVFDGELASYERLREVEMVAARRGRAWGAWLRAVRRSLDDCQQALYRVQAALLECWRDLADRQRPGVVAKGRAARRSGQLTLISKEEGEGHDGIK